MLKMRPRGNFRYHTTKDLMFSLLAEDRFRQYGTVRTHHRRSSFIATAFDAKYDGVRFHA
jgi:hypothetical protein